MVWEAQIGAVQEGRADQWARGTERGEEPKAQDPTGDAPSL